MAGYDKNGVKREDGLYDKTGNYLGVNAKQLPGGYNKQGEPDALGVFDD